MVTLEWVWAAITATLIFYVTCNDNWMTCIKALHYASRWDNNNAHEPKGLIINIILFAFEWMYLTFMVHYDLYLCSFDYCKSPHYSADIDRRGTWCESAGVRAGHGIRLCEMRVAPTGDICAASIVASVMRCQVRRCCLYRGRSVPKCCSQIDFLVSCELSCLVSYFVHAAHSHENLTCI